MKIRYLLLLLTAAASGMAQLSVSTSGNAYTLVNQIIGNNITISNAFINCPNEAKGIFVARSTNLGLDSGIILTTGKAVYAIGPNNANDVSECVDKAPNFYDGQLAAIEPKANFDGCVLEFDMKPICNTIEVKYVFASEEYPEYVKKGYNDAFGFFIWGPNPAGGTYNGHNMARLPNGANVSIDNINNGTSNSGPCTNCSYYIDNSGGGTIQYDGMTTPLTASVQVNPCNNYHFKIAIADAGDCNWDSGVFLKKGGMTCYKSQLPAIASSTVASHCDWDNGMATASVSNYTGSITYNWIPGGQSSATAAGLAPGIYTCVIGLENPCPYTKSVTVTVPHVKGFTFTNTVSNIKCPQDLNGAVTVTPSGGLIPYTYSWNTNPAQTNATASGLGLGTYVCNIIDANNCLRKDTIKISASSTLKLAPLTTSALCNNPTGTADAGLTGGMAPFSYSWTTNPVQTSPKATGLVPGTYSVTVNDNDGCILGANAVVNNFIPKITITDSVIHSTCNQKNGAIFITNVGGGTSPYSYNWSGGQTTQNLTGLDVGGYLLNVTDANNCPATKKIYIQNFNYLPLSITQKDVKCQKQDGFATAVVLGGSPPLTYTWSNGQSTATATNIGQGVHTVTVTDAGGCESISSVTITNTDDHFTGSASIIPLHPLVGDDFTVTMYPGNLWHLDLAGMSNGAVMDDTINVLNVSEFGNYWITYYLTSINGCKANYRYDFFVKDYMTLYFPNTFTPNNNGVNDVYTPVGTLVKEFKMQIYNRWGQLLFNTDDLRKGWDGRFEGADVKEDVYVYKAWAVDYFSKQYEFNGHINLIR